MKTIITTLTYLHSSYVSSYLGLISGQQYIPEKFKVVPTTIWKDRVNPNINSVSHTAKKLNVAYNTKPMLITYIQK